jgi:hypothetical protein
MEIILGDAVTAPARVRVRPAGRDVWVPDREKSISLNEGELLIVPALFMGREVVEIRKPHSYVVFESVMIINNAINYKANLVVEVPFLDGPSLGSDSSAVDINRFKIPFEGEIQCDTKEVKRVEITSKAEDSIMNTKFRGGDDRLKELPGFAIVEASFDVYIYARLQ